MTSDLTIEMLRKYSNALHTQYQLHGDYTISGRHSYEAPTIEQMSTIREAHLNIIPIIKRLIATMEALEKAARPARREFSGNDTHRLDECRAIINEALRSEYSDILPTTE